MKFDVTKLKTKKSIAILSSAAVVLVAAIILLVVLLSPHTQPAGPSDSSSDAASTSSTQPTQTTQPQATFQTNLTGWKAGVGTWLETDKGYRVISAGKKNNYAMSDVVVTGKAFTYEGLVVLSDEISADGCTVSLVFGATNPENLAEGTYYTATVDLTNRFMRMFSFSKGEMVRLGALYPLKTEQVDAKTFHIKVDVNTDGFMNLYLNNEIVSSAQVPDFAGGGLGLMTYNTNALFNVVKVSDGAAGGENAPSPDPGGSQNNFKTNLTGWVGKTGTWMKTEKGFELTSEGKKTNYALSDVKRTDKGFSYEATVTLPDTRSDGVYGISLIFGTELGANLNSGTYYEAKMDIANKFCRFFSFKDGAMGRHGKMYELSAEELAQKAYTIKIDVTASGDVTMYLNGKSVCSASIPDYKGGILGLATYNTDAVFNNVNVRDLGSQTTEPSDPGTQPNFNTNLTGWVGKNGTWMKTEQGYEVTSEGKRNNFAMSDKILQKGQAFTYEAEITLPDTRPSEVYGVSLIFGANVGASFNEGYYYEAKIDVTNKIARVFRIEDGKINQRLGQVHTLTDAEQTMKTLKIKVVVAADGKMEMYINDTMINTATSETYTGGGIGLCTYNTNAVFNNVQLTLN